MELKLFVSNTANAAASATIAEIGIHLAEDSQNIVIVPDSYSLSVEQEVHNRLGIAGSFNIDVVSFTRLAIKELKGKAKKCLSKEGAVIVLKQVIDRNIDKLVHYRAVATLSGFPKEMFAVIASIRNCGYSVEEIEGAINTLIKSTKNKTKDIALLFKEYLAELDKNHEDSTTRIDKFIAESAHSEGLKNSRIFIVGFNTFTGKQYTVIEALLRVCLSVNVAVVPTNHGANSELYPSETLQRLQDLAQGNNIAAVIKKSYHPLMEPFNTINKQLFSYSNAHIQDSDNRVTLYCESNIYEEIAGVAREVCRLVNRENYRYKDIAIINVNPGDNEIIKSIFKRYGIPYFIDSKYPLAGTLAARFLLSAIKMLTFNFKSDKVLLLIKEPLFGLSEEERELCENYILKYNLSYNNFLEPLKWGEEKDKLEPIRAKIAQVSAYFMPNDTANGYAAACKEFLAAFGADAGIETFLQPLADDLISASNLQGITRLITLIEELSRLLGDTPVTLDKYYDYLSDIVSSDEISLIPQFLDSVFIGDVADSRFDNIKALFIMNATSEYLPSPHNYKAIISPLDSEMLQASGIKLYPTPIDLIREDKFLLLELFTKPAERVYIGYAIAGENGGVNMPSAVISEIEELLQKKCESLNGRFGLERCSSAEEIEDNAVTTENAYFEYLKYASKEPKIFNNAARAVSSLYQSMTAAQCLQAEMLHSDNEEPYEGCSDQYFKVGTDSAYANGGTDSACANGGTDSAYANGGTDSACANGGTDNAYANGSKVYLGKITQIESYYRCPYAHHLSYGLQLKERELASIRLVDVGNILHKIFELYFGATLGKLDVLSWQELSAECEKATAIAVAEWKRENGSISVISENMLHNIAREAKIATKMLTSNILNSNYRPKFVELSFGGNKVSVGGNMGAIDLSTEKNRYLFRGKIDRVDVCRDKVAIVDYKTGTADGSLSGLYFGIKLQLYIYLGVLTAAGYRAGGVFYLQIKDAYSQNSKTYMLDGQMLFEEENLDDCELTARKEAQQSGKQTYYCKGVNAAIKVTKSEIALKYNGKTATAEQFDLYQGYAKDMVKKALNQISEGYIPKSPLESCAGCVYKPICGEVGEESIRKKLSVRPYDAKNIEDDTETEQ